MIIEYLVLQAIHDVLDTSRTGRLSVSQLHELELSYLPVKFGILLKSSKLQKENFKDLEIHISKNEFFLNLDDTGKSVAVLKLDLSSKTYSFGVKAAADASTDWTYELQELPKTFWDELGKEAYNAIFSETSGAKRVAELFRRNLLKPVPRYILQEVAMQHDYMKRVRRNGGARDILAKEEIAILWGQKDSGIIEKLGLSDLNSEQFVSFKCGQDSERLVLLEAGHID